MRAMKDSGVKWIGDIPESWDIVRFKLLHNGLNTGEAIDKEYWTADNNDATFYTAGLLPIKTNYPSFPAWKYTNKNDLLLARNGTPYVYLPDAGSCYTDHIIRAEIKKQFNRKFIRYSLQQSILSEIVDSVSLATWSASLWNEQVIAWPAPEIQQRVVDYLDAKCAEIDALIAAKEKTNALLKERRQSIIYEAVTKGLDPTVPMKDSGVEWIGDIPEIWELRKIKYNFDVFAGATPKSGETIFWDGDIPWITPADYTTEDVFVSAGRKSITQEGMDSCATNMIPEGSIVFSKRAPVGLVAISSNRLCTNQGCLSCVPKENVDTKYYYYTMSVFSEQFDLFASGTTFKEISADSFANFKLPYPAYEMQREIAAHLDNKCSELDSAVAQNNTTIQKLKEYRQSLIYEAITGKIEI